MVERSCFAVSEDGGVAHVVLARPDELNTMNRAFWSELPAVMEDLDGSGRVRAIVLSSTGRHFSAGMDLGTFASFGDGDGDGDGERAERGRRRAQVWQLVKLLQRAVSALEAVRVPVLAAVHGACIGGAVDLVTAADLRYASADAFFCVQETNIGITADLGTLQRLPKVVPDGIAREMAYLGRRLPARRAYEVGLVNEVFDDHESLVAGVLAIAREIAAKSPLAIWGSKVALRYARDHPVDDALDHLAGWQSGMFQPADLFESLDARREGRPPAYDDLLPRPTGL
jgi:enoyl-CoA hydratase